MLMSSLERRFDEFERSTDVRVRQIEDFLTRSQRDTQGRITNEGKPWSKSRKSFKVKFLPIFLVGTASRGRTLEANGDLENRLGKLEELSRHTGTHSRAQSHYNINLAFFLSFFVFSAARTCFDLKNSGLTDSGVYYLDPDGTGVGLRPIQVVYICYL